MIAISKLIRNENILTSNSIVILFVKILFIMILYAIVWNYFIFYFNINGLDNETLQEFSGVTKILLIFVIAPITETLLFQSLIIYLVLKFYKKGNNYSIAIILSSVAFSLTHMYNVYYFFYALGLGLVFAYFYINLLSRKSNPIFLTILLHSIFNGVGYMLSQLFP